MCESRASHLWVMYDVTLVMCDIMSRILSHGSQCVTTHTATHTAAHTATHNATHFESCVSHVWHQFMSDIMAHMTQTLTFRAFGPDVLERDTHCSTHCNTHCNTLQHTLRERERCRCIVSPDVTHCESCSESWRYTLWVSVLQCVAATTRLKLHILTHVTRMGWLWLVGSIKL